MTAWDLVDTIMKTFPPIAAGAFLLALGILFAIGFSRHGMNFIKYGFKQIALDSSFEKRFDEMEAKQIARDSAFEKRFDDFEKRFDEMEARFDARFAQIDTRIAVIETNHFGHLKNYLGILNGVLLDKEIIDNETKARLDNELRGM
jgi:hypothetical protein